MLYSVLSLVVESEIPLLDFEQIPAGVPALSVQRREDPFDWSSDLSWADVWSDVWSAAGGTTTRPAPVWRVAWDGDDLLLTISKCAEFRIEHAFRRVVCRPYSTTSDHAVKTQLSYNVLPRVLAELGHLVVHASCVSLDGGGSVLFMGPSGAGKSTLAASFVGNGGDFLSDDCVLLRTEGGHLVADVTGGDARLWDDSLTHLAGGRRPGALISKGPTAIKWRHPTGSDKSPQRSTRIDAIFHLPAESDAGCDDVVMTPETGPRLLALLSEVTLLLAPGGRRNWRGRFEAASDAASACPAFYSLRYPRTFASLPAVRRAVVSRVLECTFERSS